MLNYSSTLKDEIMKQRDDTADNAEAGKKAKLDVQVGNIRFNGEGEQAWLAEQFQKAMEAAATAGPLQAGSAGSVQTPSMDDGGAFTMSLAAYIRAKGAEGNQTKRFLVTADWLRRRGQHLTTSSVAKALVENQQRRLANPADCLNKNVSKGFCEKTKDGFFITPEGLDSLR